MIRCLIIDDEPPAVRLLEAYCDRVSDLEVAATFTSAVAGLEYLSDHQVDLLLLDVQMPDLTGLQVLKILKDPPLVVLTTAYPDYALAGYELNVADYLLKPIGLDRFLESITRIRERLANSASGPTPAPRQSTAPAPAPTYLFVKSGHKTVRIDLEDLVRLEGMSNYVALHLADGTKLLTLDGMTQLLEKLPAERFVRIHRSHAVALDKIDYLERARVVAGEARLPVSDKYKNDLMGRIG